MNPTDVVLFLLYLGHQAQVPAFWTRAFLGGAGLLFLLTVLSLMVMLARAVLTSRQLVSLSDKPLGVIGKPLLFPVNFMHTRLSPVKDKFSNRFLIVGVPVGLRCRIGNLVAIDDSSLDVSPAPGDEKWFWKRIWSHLCCWWTIDAAKLLHRGDHGVNLRKKLDNFLMSQNEDPAQWPYAYMMSVPQFMGWYRNVVSWWYLYNEQRELDALILEINNSYEEKRNILIRVRPTSDKLSALPSSPNAEFIDDRQLVQSLPSETRARFYGGEWYKYIFASPFEKVDGVVSQRMMDPLKRSAWTSKASFSNMTTLDETGQVRMATRLVCDGPPIDPMQMSNWDVIKLVFRMTLPGMLTTAEIVIKALRIRFSGAMQMNKKTPVRSGSVGRHITKMEFDLETIFRAYLARCIAKCPEPVKLTYLPCRSFTNDVVVMQSPASLGKHETSVRHVSVEPADPAFYTRFITYKDVRSAIEQETKETGLPADPTSRHLIVSDADLLLSVLESGAYEKADLCESSTASQKHSTMLSICRGTSAFMDEFALSILDPSSRTVYMAASFRLSMARRLAFGSLRLFRIFSSVAALVSQWLLLDGLSFVCGKFAVDKLTGSHLDPWWTGTAGMLLGYGSAIRAVNALKKWALR
ncbi:hypothetical protein BJX68DRAFT_255383 [Aspergillus pseudodeflectus]|uniref:Cytochrome P450 n=1 Tax=Aspergillus pseudodeflectus TaxID=176178 RepID=A0ABR4KBK6_9EURO